MKNNKHIDDFFREKLGKYSEIPPADAWGDLDKKLDTLVPHVPNSPFRWLGHAAMVTIIAVLGVSVVQKLTGTNTNTEVVKQQNINKIDAANAEFNTDAATASANGTSIPGFSNEGNENSSENKNNSSVSVTNPQQTTEAEGKNAADRNQTHAKQISVNAGKVGKTTARAGISSPSQPGSFSAQSETEIEPKNKVEEYNSAVNQEVKKIEDNKLQVAKPATSPAKATPTKPEAIATKEKNIKKKPDFARFEAGIKGGYERGFKALSATKYVIAPYVQFNLSPKLSVMLQPAAKYANSPVRTIGATQSYYNVNNDGTVTDMGTKVVTRTDGSSTDSFYRTTFRYSQSHDSVAKTNTYGGTYLEFELPVLLRYSLTKKTSVYGGVNMVFSKTTGVKENTYIKSGIRSMADTTLEGALPRTKPNALPINEVITYNGTPFSEYNGPLYPATQSSQIRFGALLGFTYEYSDRWLLDALIQQNPAPKDMKGGYNINVPLSATYFRLSVGYKLTK